MLAEGRLRLQKPLYAEEPHYLLLDRRDEPADSPDGVNYDDPFWVARGRRQLEMQSASDDEDSLWTTRVRPTSIRGLHKPMSAYEPVWAAWSPESEQGFLESVEEPFWAARGKRSSFRFLEDLPSRSGLLKSLSTNELCWAARCQRSINEDSRNKRGFLESLSAEEPFWAARGKRSATDEFEESQDRRERLETKSADEPAWTAFGKKSTLSGAQESRNKCCLLESISAEQPLWAARRRRNDDELEEKIHRRGSLLDSLSAEEPFWAARGRRGFLESLSTEEPFWAARGKKDSPRMTPPSPEYLLSQVSSLHTRTKLRHTSFDIWNGI